MRKFVTLLLLLFSSVAFGQAFTNPRSSPAITVQDSRMRPLLNFYLPHTHGLTFNGGLDTLGMTLYEDSSGHVWYRDTVLSGGHKWVQLVKSTDISIPGLNQVLGVGNTTTIPILSTASISGDSALFRNAILNGNVFIGDTVYPAFLASIGNGSSITAGSFATNPTVNGYAAKLAHDFLWTLTNSAQSGSPIAPPAANALFNRITLAPNNTGGYYFFDAGINDTINVSAYITYLTGILDTLTINKAWLASHVIIISPPYSPARLYDSVYIAADSIVAAAFGAVFVNIWRPMKNIYPSNPGIIFSDSLHPSTSGHAFIEQLVSHALFSIPRSAILVVNGSDTIRLNETVQGDATINGVLYPLGAIGQPTVDGGVRFLAPTIGSNGQWNAIKLVPNPGNASVIDSFEIRHIIRTGAQSQLGVYHMKTVPFPVFFTSTSDQFIIGDSIPQSGYQLTVKGATYTDGNMFINGGITIQGNNVYNAQMYPFFKAFGNYIGIGCPNTNEIQISNAFGDIAFGFTSGSTFTGNSRFKVNGTKLLVNSSVDNGAFLQVGAGTASIGQMYFNPSTFLTSPANGMMEATAANIFYTIGGTRYPLALQAISGSVSQVGSVTTTFTVTIGATQANSTYKVNVTPTDALAAAPYYINNKTTTTFDVVYLSGLTGTVTFDWALFP